MAASRSLWWGYVWILYLTTTSLLYWADGCNYGALPGCVYECHCDNGVACNQDDGSCPDGCDDGNPSGTFFSGQWSGPACQIGNVAYGKPATQGPNTLNDNYAGQAVNGDLDPVLTDANCAAAQSFDSSLAWWEVNLQDEHVIQSVTIVNRNYHKYRLSDTLIEVGNADGSSYNECGSTSSDPDIVETSIDCKRELLGHSVRLMRKEGASDQSNINICEVMVIGYRVGSLPPGGISELMMWVVIGVVLGAVVILLVVLVVVILWRKGKLRKKLPKVGRGGSGLPLVVTNHRKASAASTAAASHHSRPKTKRIQGTIRNIQELSIPIETDQLLQYIQQTNGLYGRFLDEFQLISRRPTEEITTSVGQAALEKNRTPTLLAYDHSRVALQTSAAATAAASSHKDGENLEITEAITYINANYIYGYKNNPRGYIACQGPIPSTVNDMWTMIWQQKVNRIVMVTNLKEKGEVMCEQYWPSTGSATYRRLVVTLESAVSYADYTIRTLNITHKNEQRTLWHFQYTSWPEDQLPRTASSLLEMRRKLRALDPEASGPLLVHGSDGVGRTGVFVAIDHQLQKSAAEDQIDVLHYMATMRAARINMISTHDQYGFVYSALLEAQLTGQSHCAVDRVIQLYPQLVAQAHKPSSALANQFTNLESLKPESLEEDDTPAGLEPINADKNFSERIIPDDRHRPRLAVIDGSSDYINAVFVDSFTSSESFIATQMPLVSTVTDFWRLVFEFQPSAIITLTDPDTTDPALPVYWPRQANNSVSHGSMVVENLSEEGTQLATLRLRKLRVSSTTQRTRGTHTVSHYCYGGWHHTQSKPPSTGDILYLASIIKSTRQHSDNSPIIVQCRDGAHQSGLLLAASLLLEKMSRDKEADVLHVVKLVRCSRPQFVTNLEQYTHLHELAHQYVSHSTM